MNQSLSTATYSYVALHFAVQNYALYLFNTILIYREKRHSEEKSSLFSPICQRGASQMCAVLELRNEYGKSLSEPMQGICVNFNDTALGLRPQLK